jgi:hypothetical protein
MKILFQKLRNKLFSICKVNVKLKKQPINYLVVSLFFILLISLVILIYFWDFKKEKLPTNQSITKQTGDIILQPEFQLYRFIDGLPVKDAKEINPELFAVMIENMIEARPLAGLAKASLVYEAISEAGITRFLAIYPATVDVEKIGPVRSARLYYLDWAEEYGALYAHCGGSPEALRAISNYNIFNLDEFSNAKYFWRAKNRGAPHNLYTSTELLKKALEDKDWIVKPDFTPWQFKSEEPKSGDVQQIKIDFSSPAYQVTWKYDQEKNDYLRWQAGEIQKDEDGTQIWAKNIVVQFVKMWVVDEVGRKKMETIGSGRALIFQDGKSIEGEWRKKEKGARTKFYDQNGNEIKFNPGVTWIEVVPIGTNVEF